MFVFIFIRQKQKTSYIMGQCQADVTEDFSLILTSIMLNWAQNKTISNYISGQCRSLTTTTTKSPILVICQHSANENASVLFSKRALCRPTNDGDDEFIFQLLHLVKFSLVSYSLQLGQPLFGKSTHCIAAICALVIFIIVTINLSQTWGWCRIF